MLLPLRYVDAEGVIKAAIFADQNDDVLDRARGLYRIRLIRIPLMLVVRADGAGAEPESRHRKDRRIKEFRHSAFLFPNGNVRVHHGLSG